MLLNKLFSLFRIFLVSFLIFVWRQSAICWEGEVNTNNINIRSDSTVSSKVICALNRGSRIEVIKEQYNWYKIRLPKNASTFIRKDLVVLIDNKTAKVLKDKVNIRLGPSESSEIVGCANKDEIVNVLEEKKDWLRIEPTGNCFGWVHKKFINKVEDLKKNWSP